MFKNRNNDYNPGVYEGAQIQRIIYELDEINRKLRNLNNRLRRVEGFLGLSVSNDDNNTNNS